MTHQADIVDGRCKICDRQCESDRTNKFLATFQDLDPSKLLDQTAAIEAVTHPPVCLVPGSLACLGRAVDWRKRYQELFSHSADLANDTLSAVSRMVNEHNAQMAIAQQEGRRAAQPVIDELRARIDLLNKTMQAVRAYLTVLPESTESSQGINEFVTMRNYMNEVARLEVLAPEARTWHDGVEDAIKNVLKRRDQLSRMATLIVTPSPAAMQMIEDILKSLRSMLARGQLDEG